MMVSRYLKKIGALLGFLKVSDMRKMNVYVHKNKATSRHSRELYCQCHDVEIQCCDVLEGESFNVVTLGSNVATFPRVT